MSQQLHTAMTAILGMGYYRNDPARSGSVDHGHERAVADVLRAHKFQEADRAQFPRLTKGLLKKWADGVTGSQTALEQALALMPEGAIIVQPAGSQGFPDILVKDWGGRLVAVECKSGKNGLCPMWNDNVPKQEAIYVLSSGRAQETTLFLGRDVISPEVYRLMREQELALQAVVARYSALITQADSHSRGWIQKSRKQHFQGGGQAKTNYFTHQDRKTCETRALDYAGQ